MSPASRAVKRLRDLYGSVFRRMRAHDARLADPLTGRVHFQGIEQLEPRLLLSGWPTLDSFSVAGQDISSGGAYHATYQIVGPSRDVWVESQWSNTGDDNSGHGGITLSFPGYSYYSSLGISTSSDFYYTMDSGPVVTTTKQYGDSINTLWGGRTASHIMFEGDDTLWDGNDWGFDEEHNIGVRIYTPSSSTRITALVRATMGDANWGNIIRNPYSESANGDQQGWPTYYYYIYVDAIGPYAPGSLDMTDSYDTGMSADDEITRESNPQFQWTKPSDRGYDSTGTAGTSNYYYWEVDSSSGSAVKSGYASSTSVRPGTLSDGDYTFWVRAQDAVGNWGSWSSLSFTIDTQGPLPPTFTSPSESGSTFDASPTLDWDNVSGAWKYQVYVREDGLPYLDSRTSLELSSSSWTVSPDLAAKAWGWQVRVCDVAGNWGPYGRNGVSGGWGHFTVATPQVTSLRWEDTSGNPISLVEAGATVRLRAYAAGMDGQSITVRIYEDDFWTGDDDQGTKSITLSGGTGYATWTAPSITDPDPLDDWYPEFYFQYETTGLNSGIMNVQDTLAPYDPGSLTAASAGGNNWNLDWSDVTDRNNPYGSGLDHYQLQVDDSSDFSSPVIDQSTGTTSFAAVTLSPNTRYYWRVQAVDHRNNASSRVSGPAFGQQVTSLRWEDTSGNPISLVEAGTTVRLRAYAQGMDGQTITVRIYEDDFWSGDDDQGTKSITLSAGTGYATWTAPSITDPDPLDDWYPEFYFQYETTGLNSGIMNVQDTLAPYDPSSLSATSAGGNNWNLDWSDVTDRNNPYGSGLDHYQLQVDDSSDFSSPVIDQSTGTTSFAAVTLSPNTRYYWRVQAVDHRNNASSRVSGPAFGQQVTSLRWEDASGNEIAAIEAGQTVYANITGTGLSGTIQLQVWEDDFPAGWYDTGKRIDVPVISTGGRVAWTADWDSDALYGIVNLTSDPEYKLHFVPGGVASNALTVTDDTAPTAPSPIDPAHTADLDSVLVHFSWTDSIDSDYGSGFDHYELTVSRYVDLRDPSVKIIDENYADVTLGDGSFYWKVTAYDAEGNPSSSGVKSFTVTSPGIAEWAADLLDAGVELLGKPLIYAEVGGGLPLIFSVGTGVYFDVLDLVGLTQDARDGYVTTYWTGSFDLITVSLGLDTLAGFEFFNFAAGVLRVPVPDTSAVPSGSNLIDYDVSFDPITTSFVDFSLAFGLLQGSLVGAQAGLRVAEDINTNLLSFSLFSLDWTMAQFEVDKDVVWDILENAGIGSFASDVINDLLYTGTTDFNTALNDFDQQPWVRDFTQWGGALPQAAPVIEGVPDQTLNEDGSLNNAIDLWAYASDADTPDSGLTFSIIGNTNPSVGASIDSNRFIDIAPAGNWYGASDVTIQVSDGQRTDNDTFRITVNSVNDKPTASIVSVSPSPAQPPTQTVSFDGSSGDIDGTVVAWEWTSNLDGLLGTSQDWSASSNNLTVGTHTISFRAKDNDSAWSDPVTKQVVISNAMPTADPPGMPGSPVAPGSTFTAILSGHDNDENQQAIVGGRLYLDGSLIANPTPGICVVTAPTGSGSHTLAYQVQDDEEMWSNQASAIFTVIALNQPPTDISLSNSSVSENEPVGTAVGNLSTTDPDVGDTFDYSLVSGAGSTDNASFTISGNQLRTAASFDYEAKSGYSIRVRTTDQGGLSYEKQFTISVTNVNEQPTDIALSNSSVSENLPSGTVVGNLSTTDPDAGDTFVYSLVSGTGSTDNSSFTLSGNQLKTAASFNYEAKNVYSIRIRTADQGGTGLNYQKVFTISVTDVDDTAPQVNGWSSAATHGTVGEIMLAVPDNGMFSEPRNTGIHRLVVQFSEPINPASFTAGSIQIAGLDIGGNDVNLSGITISTSTRNGNTEGVIDFSAALPNVAKYLVRVEGVTDVAGNPLAGDNDRILTALVGDAFGDRRINGTDLAVVNANRVNPINPATDSQVRSEVFVDGRVNSTDLSAVWAHSGDDARFIPDPVLTTSLEATGGANLATGEQIEAAALENSNQTFGWFNEPSLSAVDIEPAYGATVTAGRPAPWLAAQLPVERPAATLLASNLDFAPVQPLEGVKPNANSQLLRAGIFTESPAVDSILSTAKSRSGSEPVNESNPELLDLDGLQQVDILGDLLLAVW